MNFSIIIPTYNRSQLLKKSLINLSKLSYPRNKFEVIVVNNNSTDNTEGVIQKFILSHRELKIRYVFESKQGHVFACNTGIKVTRYSKIIFCDDDIDVTPNFIGLYRDVYRKFPKASIVGGQINADFPAKKGIHNYLRKTDLWMMGVCNNGNKMKLLTGIETVFSGNMSVALSRTQKKQPLFDEKLGHLFGKIMLYGQDYELCLRSHLEGKIVIYDPKIRVVNKIESNRLALRYVFKRQLAAGIERYLIDQKLSRYHRYVQYNLSWPNLAKQIVKTLVLFKIELLLANLEDIAYTLGYAYLGKMYLEKSRWNFILNWL